MLRLLVTRLRKLMRGMTSPLLRRALGQGVGATVEHDRILALRPWRTIVDIGANRGQFALAAHRLHPKASVHSFEPQAGPCDVFARIFASTPAVRLHRCAIGASEARMMMHVSARDDSSSLLPIGRTQAQVFPGTHAVGSAEVSVRPLAAELAASDIVVPALLKLDVQGYELPALQGCEPLLERFDAVYVECSLVELAEGQALFGTVVGWLAARGFELVDIGPLERFKGRAIQGDFYFQRRLVEDAGVTASNLQTRRDVG